MFIYMHRLCKSMLRRPKVYTGKVLVLKMVVKMKLKQQSHIKKKSMEIIF